MSGPIVHLAAIPAADGRQRCLICGETLTDNRKVLAVHGPNATLTWWPEGVDVTVWSNRGMTAGAHFPATRCSELS